MRKFLVMLLAATMLVSMLASCGSVTVSIDETAEEAQEETAEEIEAILPEKLEAGTFVKAAPSLYPIDLSKEETIHICLVGDKPNDMEQITEIANEYLKPYNTKIEFTFWGWAEYAELYSLSLTAGENVDLIFTAPWCYLWTEGSKGSFLTLDDEFVSTYMPLTAKYQIPESWNGVKLNGEAIAVPQNISTAMGQFVGIRQDLAEKYGITELTSWEDYKNFCLTIAEKETPESGILAYAASLNNSGLWIVYSEQFGSMTAASTQDYISYIYPYNPDENVPSWDEIKFSWDSDWFRSFCADMKEMADAGCWSRSALTNEVQSQDAFGALQSASIAWTQGMFPYFEIAEKTEGVVCAAYDITMDHFAPCEAYNNNDMAIAACSKNPQRAAMILDLVKNDTELAHLLRFGIEGTHYELSDEFEYIALDKSEDYSRDCLSMDWATKAGDVVALAKDPRERAIVAEQTEKMVACPTEGFVFDDSSVSAECSAVNAILKEYIPSLQLGLMDDFEAAIDEMLASCNAAGLEKIEAEIQAQYEAWYENMK